MRNFRATRNFKKKLYPAEEPYNYHNSEERHHSMYTYDKTTLPKYSLSWFSNRKGAQRTESRYQPRWQPHGT